MTDHNNILRIIGTTSALTVAGISAIFGLATKSGWALISAITIFSIIALIYWQWILAVTERLTERLEKLNDWLYQNDVICLLIGTGSLVLGAMLFLNMLSNLRAFGLTMFLGTTALVCMFGSCLIVPFFEKRFGKM